MARKYFGTDGVRGKVGQAPITVEFAVKLGNAVGRVLGGQGQVIIGQDTRQSSDVLKLAFVTGMTAAGVDVVSLGVVPTPVVAFMTKTTDAIAGVVISASHNPYYDNGIKFFSSAGYKLSDEVEYKIEQYVQEEFCYESLGKFGQFSSRVNQIDPYIDHCIVNFKDKVKMQDKKIVVDCANGAMYRAAKIVFEKLGLNIVMISSRPDGFNINEACGAVHLESLKAEVKREKAALGIAFDGDGDRLMLVDEIGETFDGDEILLLLAQTQASNGSKCGVVGTVMTNLAVEQKLNTLGITFQRAKVGDRYVLEKLQENKWSLGGESSGHLINLAYNTTGDGLLAALQVLAALSVSNKNLSEVLNVSKMPQTMINVPLVKKLDANDMSLVMEDVMFVEKSLSDNGRVVLRPSGTEPVLRVMVEAKNIELAIHWARYLVEKVEQKIS